MVVHRHGSNVASIVNIYQSSRVNIVMSRGGLARRDGYTTLHQVRDTTIKNIKVKVGHADVDDKYKSLIIDWVLKIMGEVCKK